MPEVPQIPCPLGHAQLTFFVAKGIFPSGQTDLLKSPTPLYKKLTALSTQVQMALLHTLNPLLEGVTPKQSHIETGGMFESRNCRNHAQMAWQEVKGNRDGAALD